MKTSQALLRKTFGFLGLMFLAVACHQPTSDDLSLVQITEVGVSGSNMSVQISIGQAGPSYFSDFDTQHLLDWNTMVSVPNHTIVSYTLASNVVTLLLGENLSTSTSEMVVFNTSTVFYAATADGVNKQKCRFAVGSCQIQ